MGIWKQGRFWKYAFLHDKKKYGGGGYKTKTLALMAREDRRARLLSSAPLPPSSSSLSSAISSYISYMRDRVVPRTLDYKRYVLVGFLSSLPSSSISLSNIREENIISYLSTRPSKINYNRHRKEISAFFNFCIKRRFISVNPLLLIDKLPEDRTPRAIPSREDLQKVLAVCSPRQKALLLVLLHSLGRISEICSLTWADVDFDNNTLTLWTRKVKGGSLTPDHIPINSALQKVLRDLWENRLQDKYVFFNNKTKTRYTRRPKMMRGLCKKAGVKYFGFHGIRHFSASYLAQSGECIKTLQGLLRHRSPRTTEIYLHHLEGSSINAVNRLSSLFG